MHIFLSVPSQAKRYYANLQSDADGGCNEAHVRLQATMIKIAIQPFLQSLPSPHVTSVTLPFDIYALTPPFSESRLYREVEEEQCALDSFCSVLR